jgi:hypothetical protein
MVMKRFIWLVAPVMLGAAQISQAQADTWCIRDSGGGMFSACGFSSAGDCVRAALVGPGGICAREELPAAAEPAKSVAVKHVRHKAPHKQKQAER